MSYNSNYTGQEVEQLLDKAGTAIQPDNVATVATSGSYEDLTDKPTIPSEVTESTVSGWGFVTEDYVTDAIASAITTTLNTAV